MLTDGLPTVKDPIMTADTSKNSFWVRVEKLSVIFCYYELSDGVPWIVDNRMDGTKFQVLTASQPSSHPDKVYV